MKDILALFISQFSFSFDDIIIPLISLYLSPLITPNDILKTKLNYLTKHNHYIYIDQ